MATPYRTLTILGQDPNLRSVDGRLLTARVQIPNEEVSAGPRGYRVQVVDYDASASRLYKPLDPAKMGTVADPRDPFVIDSSTNTNKNAKQFNARLLDDPQFHAQNVYAIVMRTLMHFERALGRRVSWSFGGHQLKVAPHAFAEANAFYSKRDEALLFGYFAAPQGGTIFTCLSHDIIAHETTHALLDGLRPRYMEPSSPDQAAFHEGFADVVALLSVFSIPEVVSVAVHAALATQGETPSAPFVPMANPEPLLPLADLTINALRAGILLGLGEQFGEALSGVRGASLRRSVTITPSKTRLAEPEFREPHRRGEILVAAMLQTFLQAYHARLSTLGRDTRNRLPAVRVIEEGSEIADRMLTMAIRALDYLPPTDIAFGDFVSALVTSDLEIRPDDSRYQLREHLRNSFAQFGITPSAPGPAGGEPGRWDPPLDPTASGSGSGSGSAPRTLDYGFVHREALERDREEVFRFLWQNRRVLGLCDEAYTAVEAVRPCLRVDQDGFTLRETVADYIQILTVRADELTKIDIPGRPERIEKPDGLGDWKQVRLLGGGALIFDEFGRLKYHIHNAVLNPLKQTERLRHLFLAGFFDHPEGAATSFEALHLRGLQENEPAVSHEVSRWL